MGVSYYVVDAFVDGPSGVPGEAQLRWGGLSGNPAGVCLLEASLPAALMQQIAAENNLAETAFVLPNGDDYDLRWFTPTTEIDLCGHATLASAFVLHNFTENRADTYRFHTQSGLLTVTPRGELLEMDFPAWPLRPVEITARMRQAVGGILEAQLARDLILVLGDEAAVRGYQPDFAALAAIPESFGVAITAPGDSADYVTRFFAPGEGIPEDPVTGSLQSELIPFWAARLGKDTLTARQLSRRGGTLHCEYHGERVKIAGRARLYLTGEICV